MGQLFDPGPLLPREQRSRALVRLTDRCPDHDTPLTVVTWGQPALFRHGGWGATEARIEWSCPVCGWVRSRRRFEAHPNWTPR